MCYVLIPVLINGQRGKKMTRISIVRLHGKRLSWWTMFLRELIRKAFSGFILFIDFLMALVKEKRALHDYIAGTAVVWQETADARRSDED
jgi:uncharacterized RDD family membrane protein YckC